MNPVPSTHTAADANLERQAIQKDIVSLIGTRDVLKEEVALFEKSLENAKSLLEEMKKETEQILEEGKNATDALERTKVYLSQVITGLEEKNRSIWSEISDLEPKVEERRAEYLFLTAEIDSAKLVLADVVRIKDITTREHTESKSALVQELEEIQENLHHAELNLVITKNLEQESLNYIQEEEKRLGILRSDLAIYEGRIRRAAVLVGMDPNAILL